MPDTIASAVIPASVETTWAAIRDFNGLPVWHPAISASELEGSAAADQVGAVRRLTLADGAEVREVLNSLDDHHHHYTYEILTSPFPVVGYRSTISVTPLTTTGESFVAWTVTFDCDLQDSERLSRLFSEDVFGTGLQGLTGFVATSG